MTPPADERRDSAAASSWAEKMVTKWDANHSPYASVQCIFHESRDEARRFLSAVRELQVLGTSSASSLIESAMRRLQKELYHVLQTATSNLYEAPSEDQSSDSGDGDSSYDEDQFFSALSIYQDDLRNPRAAALSYLRSVADCMISAGCVRHCTAFYVACRREAVEDALRRFGFDPHGPHTKGISRDGNKTLDLVDDWLAASRVAVRAVFARERVLCDAVFGSNAVLAESCFAEVVRDDAADVLIRFPRALVGKISKGRAAAWGTPSTAHQDKVLLGLLEVHGTLRELMPELEALFSSKATADLLEQAWASTEKVENAVRRLLADVEMSLRKDGQRKKSSSLPPGGGLHPLTLRVVSLLSSLADHTTSLYDILFRNMPTGNSSPISPRKITTSSASDPASSIFAWLLTVLLCKFDVRAELYRDPATSYLFLANNLRYITSQMRAKRALLAILGTEWANSHEQKARRFTASHLRLAWAKVTAALPADLAETASQLDSPGGVEAVAERVREFNAAFDAAYRSLAECVVPDDTAREELRRCAIVGVVGPYKDLYGTCRGALLGSEGVVRFAPEDVMARMGDLYSGAASSSSGCSSNGSSSSSSGPGSFKGSMWSWVGG